MIECFADDMPVFVHLFCFIGLGGEYKVTHPSLGDLFRLVLDTFDDKEELQGEEAPHFLNSIIKKGLEVKDKRL